MKKNRYLLCLLATGFMLYFAVPRLTVTIHDLRGIFSLIWLVFALIVVSGNLIGLLYSPKKQNKLSGQKQKVGRKSRSFH
ncbi:MAG: hypothetical protein Q8934_15360 [Bacillota bacterium]|nr:hypothetical protein [Bacillota bacterium]